MTTVSSSVPTTLDTDREFVIARLVDAIGDNIETPIDFVAVRSGSSIILNAQTTGAVSGMWTITVSHGGGDGNLAFGTATVNRIGSSTFTATSFPSGTLGGGNYQAASAAGHNFIGERLVSWTEGEDEPVVSNNPNDYAFSRLT